MNTTRPVRVMPVTLCRLPLPRPSHDPPAPDRNEGRGEEVVADAHGHGGGADPALVDVAADFGAAIVCTHTGGLPPRTRPFRIEGAERSSKAGPIL